MRTLKLALALLPIFSLAEDMSEAEADKLAKAAQNPIANMISLPFQNNTNVNIGDTTQSQNILNIQPVWTFITRTIIPVVSNPSVLTGSDRVGGVGDTLFTGFFSPKYSGSLTWGVGPVLLLPTETDDKLGQDTWAGGISAVVLAMHGKWVLGSLVSNIWSFGGGDADINLFTWQYFVNYNIADSWYVVSASIITANWEVDSDHRWTVPLGGGVGKIFKVGKLPINAQLSLYENVITPDDYGPEW